MTAIYRNGRTFGKVPMRAFTGSKGRCREASRWEFNPQTLKEAEVFRGKREDRSKHITAWSPCPTAPIETPMSFYQRNMFKRFHRVAS
jgi:hypothetical protein